MPDDHPDLDPFAHRDDEPEPHFPPGATVIVTLTVIDRDGIASGAYAAFTDDRHPIGTGGAHLASDGTLTLDAPTPPPGRAPAGPDDDLGVPQPAGRDERVPHPPGRGAAVPGPVGER